MGLPSKLPAIGSPTRPSISAEHDPRDYLARVIRGEISDTDDEPFHIYRGYSTGPHGGSRS